MYRKTNKPTKNKVLIRYTMIQSVLQKAAFLYMHCMCLLACSCVQGKAREDYHAASNGCFSRY